MISFRRRVIEPFLVGSDYAHESAPPPKAFTRQPLSVFSQGEFAGEISHPHLPFLKCRQNCRAVIHPSAGFIAQAVPYGFHKEER